MNCYYHPDQPAIGYCSECGKSLCKACVDRYGTNLCCDCVNAYGAKLKADKRKLLIRTGVIFGTVLILCLASGYFPFYVALVLLMRLRGFPVAGMRSAPFSRVCSCSSPSLVGSSIL